MKGKLVEGCKTCCWSPLTFRVFHSKGGSAVGSPAPGLLLPRLTTADPTQRMEEQPGRWRVVGWGGGGNGLVGGRG